MRSKLLLLMLPILLLTGLAKATPLSAVITGSNNVLCNGGTNGTATVLASGGTSPYTYAWSPSGGSGSTATGLTAGTYTVVVTDFASNTATATVNITQPAPIIMNATSSYDVSCFGGNNGDIYEGVSGGTPPYSYMWSPSGQTTAFATGLSAGTYTMTVIDNNGCTGTTTFTITQPTQITAISSTIPNSSCSSPNGSASVTVIGGTPGYSYLWTPGSQTNATATGLNAGYYNCRIKDQNGCIDTIGVIVTGASGPSATLYVTPDTSLCDGAITSVVTGGTAPYTYLWTPGGQTTATIMGLCTGNYCLTVTDNHGCTDYTCDTVTSNFFCTLGVTMSSTAVTCANNGTVTANAYAGTPPYTYLWSPGGATTATVTGITGGTYSVTVHDSTGCVASGTVSVTSSSISYTISGTPASIATGDSTLLALHCNTSATYSWSPSASVTNPTSSSSYAHPTVTTEYTVTVTTGCGSFVDSVLITVNCFNLSVTSTSSSCSSGTATATPSSGIAPYTYLWQPGGQTTASITGLSAGTYSVTVHDSTGCSVTASVVVTGDSVMYYATASPASIIVGDSTLLNAHCNVSATYSWSPSATITNPNSSSSYAKPAVTTEYTVTITTACGTFTDSVLVTVSCFSVTTTSTSSYCTSGTAVAHASGGTPPYTYLWAPGGQTTDSISGLSAGTYTVVVHDFTGCSVTSYAYVSVGNVIQSASGTPAYINAGDSARLVASCNLPATYSWAPSASVTSPTSAITYAHPTAATVYTVTITTACGTYTDTVLINVNCFALAMSSTPAYYCTSSYDGTATATPSGGTPPYTYLWSPSGQTLATATGLFPYTYTVTVHDNTGCSSQATVGVSSAAASLTVSAFPSVITLGDSSYLSASFPLSATYVWTPGGQTSQDITVYPTVTTTYTVTATDSCGTQTKTVTVVVATCSNNYNEPICIVTIDTNNKPVVIWGRTNSPPQSGSGSYMVYRENSSSVFVPVDNQPLNVLSDYVDMGADPSLAPVSYKLATDDSCGESALSPVHTTIYLTTTSGFNVYILNWTAYVGFTPSKYRIYRGPSMSAMVQIDSVPGSTLTYHDTLPPLGSIYLVEAVNPSSSCVPTTTIRHRTAARALSGSFSNGFNSTILGVENLASTVTNLNLYPNPSNGNLTIEWSVISGQSPVVRISVVDELGRIVYDNTQNQVAGYNKQQLNLENLASGIYSLRLQTNSSITVKKLVIMRK